VALRTRFAALLFALPFPSLLAVACETRYAQTAEAPLENAHRDGGTAHLDGGTAHRDGGSSPNRCGATLASSLAVTHVPVDADIRQRRAGYNLLPEDERIAFSVDADGAAKVAWLDAAGTRVHVTPLDVTFARSAPDVVMDGIEVGGLVAQKDGFALLTRRADPGAPLADPAASGAVGKAAVFVRVRNGIEEVVAPLTGTASVTTSTLGPARDCAMSPLHGRLEWNGAKYGAYFAMHGCEGDVHASYYGDKLAYLDDGGRGLAGGWAWNCSINEGLRLLPERDVFTSVCLSDGTPFPGLDLVVAGRPPVELSPEMSTDGYSAGKFGSIVKMRDGTYVVGWLSRGVVDANASPVRATKRAPDVALLRLGADYASLGPLTWVTQTDNVAEANLHLAPYGADRLLVAWDSIESLKCGPQTCFGQYTGTHLRLLDLHGMFLSPDTLVPAVPNTDEDLRVLPNGDIAWAFVAEAERNYADPLVPADGGVDPGAPSRTLSVARLAFCP
jgi:hypothetical protein